MRLISINEASTYLRMSTMTVYRLAKSKKIPAIKVGGSWRINLDILEKKFGDLVCK